MTVALALGAGAREPSPVLLWVFVAGGLLAIGCGLNWILGVRGAAARRTEKDACAAYPPPGYLRLLGSLLTAAGVVLLLVTYLLWHLG